MFCIFHEYVQYFVAKVPHLLSVLFLVMLLFLKKQLTFKFKLLIILNLVIIVVIVDNTICMVQLIANPELLELLNCSTLECQILLFQFLKCLLL